jgi:predicted CXXCH cytochrome family protein
MMIQRKKEFWCLAALCLGGLVSATAAQERVSETVHNLSASGPGRIRAPGEGQVCVFCHAPHNTAGVSPLWNRELSVSSYRIYESSTLDAKPGQPTGSSKLCLSCHDGTIALGSLLSRNDRVRMTGGDFLPAGLTNLGTDLSDDHPISFYYTAGIAASDRQLVDPMTLRAEVKLDATGQLQCTSCHNPHDDRNGNFLVTREEYGELCVACHRMTGWSSGAHANAQASVARVSGVDWPYASVAQNACRSCHRSHTAGGRERLLIFEKEEDNCLDCHDGTVARSNIRAELNKTSAHDPQRYVGIHDPVEIPADMQAHVECADCHNPHAAAAVLPTAAYVPIGATLAQARGITRGGVEIDEARNEYEVCFRCHGDAAVELRGGVPRQSHVASLRLQFDPGNPSFHPVIVSARSSDSPSLKPGIPPGTLIRCTDCHNNDSGPRAGGGGPDGPHGSNHEFLLERNYVVLDDTVESEATYALCYKCHERNRILADSSFPLHRLHIVDERAPCSACHDPHGISATQLVGSDHTHLINFDLQTVRRDAKTQRLAFRDLGTHSGSCTLECHGVAHADKEYGLQTVPTQTPAAKRHRRR